MSSAAALPVVRNPWKDRVPLGLLVLTAVGLAGLGASLPLLVQVALWGGLVAVTAFLARSGRIHLLGPVFVYEVVRMARRRRYFWFRVLYVLGVFGILGWMYLIMLLEMSYQRGPWRMREMAMFASSFFYVFMALQYAVVVLLTPIYTAGTIAEEKDRKTLEFVLATDLRDQEIVLGKWLARLGNLSLLVLAGLPILSFLQFQGGIDPGLLLAGFAATGLTMLSLGALGIWCSVVARKPRDAIVLTYLLVVLYHAVSGASWLVFVPITGRRGDMSVADVLDFLPWAEIIHWFNAGNIGSVLVRLGIAFDTMGSMDALLAGYLGDFALFHGLLTAAFLTWAVFWLRPVALRQAHAPVRQRRTWWLRRRPRKLSPIGDQPVVWKEVHVDRGFARMHWASRIGITLIVLASFFPAGAILVNYLFFRPMYRSYGSQTWSRLSEDMNVVVVRMMGTLISCLLLLAVAIRAAGSISGERDKQTFDGLITTPLDSDAILYGKWLGSILSVRWGWLWLASIWALGLATGGLHPLGAVLLPLTWLIYAAVFATIGLWFSMTCTTTTKATVGTLLTVILISGGHWLVMMLFCYAPLALLRVRGREFEWLLFFQMGHTPPAVFVFEALHVRDLERLLQGRREEGYIAFFGPLGVLTWAGMAWVLWKRTSKRFREMVNLITFRVPRQAGEFSPGERTTPAA